jgi:hypothetical protein
MLVVLLLLLVRGVSLWPHEACTLSAVHCQHTLS